MLNETHGTLFIANPFWDKSIRVSESFLNENGLEKAVSSIEYDPERFRNLWINAKNSAENSGKIKGMCGGGGTNVMLPLAKLGHKCTIIGRIGQDKYGVKITNHVNEIKATSLLIESRENLPSGNVLCFITPDRERTMVAQLGSTIEFTADDIIEENLQKYKHWHIEGYAFYFEFAAKCIEIASKNNATISINLPTKNAVSTLKEAFNEALPHAHFIFGNVEEIMTLAGLDPMDLNPIQKAFSSFPIDQTVAATDGANGCWVKPCGEKEAVHYPAPKIDLEDIKNKTGAGDIWAGIYLAAALAGKCVETCVQMANAGASEWIQHERGTCSLEKTQELFKKQIIK
jgi:ribokinase